MSACETYEDQIGSVVDWSSVDPLKRPKDACLTRHNSKHTCYTVGAHASLPSDSLGDTKLRTIHRHSLTITDYSMVLN